MNEDFDDEEEQSSEPDLEDVELEEEDLVEDVEGDELAEDLVEDEVIEDEDDDVVDLEEELHPDDVEEPLDVLLLERTSSGLLDEDDYEEDEDGDGDGRAEGGSRIPPKRPGEFVCRSCFLVKHPSQLADAERVLCRDCL